MIKAFIFDMDGVLFDSELLKVESWEKILNEFGIKEGNKWYMEIVGRPAEENTKATIKQFNLNITQENFFNRRREIYKNILKEKGPIPIEKNISFLKSLPRERLKIGLATSEYYWMAENHLVHSGIKNYFDTIVAGASELATQEQKPHPKIYLLSARRLGTNPENCIGIEDSSAGVESVKRAGMFCIGYKNPNSGNQDLSKANIITSNLLELNLENLLNL